MDFCFRIDTNIMLVIAKPCGKMFKQRKIDYSGVWKRYKIG